MCRFHYMLQGLETAHVANFPMKACPANAEPPHCAAQPSEHAAPPDSPRHAARRPVPHFRTPGASPSCARAAVVRGVGARGCCYAGPALKPPRSPAERGRSADRSDPRALRGRPGRHAICECRGQVADGRDCAIISLLPSKSSLPFVPLVPPRRRGQFRPSPSFVFGPSLLHYHSILYILWTSTSV
ncbi:hypothetical protein FA95DRAFT_1424958 [Auriscalpium vulgare]|uniref:Uncharacterized protein n=1 Tax=Auriscalpium vulgare TaxID=40419 RepID=A0ACB8RQQ1_9AGAM|nr:hypothetical protein FA95DRAFT_1424958 [Auriscalpium vulgare]